jgi:hypothetical protein
MRKLGALLAVGMVVVALAGCSTTKNEDVASDSSESSTSSTETERSTSTTAGSDAGSSSDDGGSGASDLDQCQAVSLLLGGLTASGAVPDDSELQQQIEDAKQNVPEDLQDDIQVIADGFQDADGIVGWGQFIASDEYRDAATNLQQYLTDNCDVRDLLPD